MSRLVSLLRAVLISFCLCAAVQAAPLDINTATVTELAETLKGVGLKKAEAIVAHREQHGPFKSVDELAEVKGIGDKTLADNRDLITVGESAGAGQKPQGEIAKKQ